MIEKEYTGLNHAVKVDIDGQIWDIVIEIDLAAYKDAYKKKTGDEEKPKIEEARKKLAEFAKVTALKLGRFRSLFYSSVMEKMITELLEKKKPEPMVVNINDKNKLTMFPENNKLFLIYGIHFAQFTDVSLIRNLLSEFQEANRHVKNSIPVSVYTAEKDTPDYVKRFDLPQNYSNGLVVFALDTSKFKVYQKKLNKFVFFREYLQFHVHFIKTFLHIKMTRKVKYLSDKLDHCKIIPDDYLRKIKDINFFVNHSKKIVQKAIFDSEVKKVQAH